MLKFISVTIFSLALAACSGGGGSDGSSSSSDSQAPAFTGFSAPEGISPVPPRED
ncbi:MAG: Uncharacterised protein [Alphaproteobacteria bacterium]|nr:MAG: Uncharacterised protein [Alphaproteobacteria bacterium]